MTAFSESFWSRWFWRVFKPQTGPQYVGPEGPTVGSVEVGESRALQVATVFACIRLLSETIGTLPLKVYKKNAKGDREEATEHPLYRLLHDTPNQYQTAIEFRETMQYHLATRGNAYAAVKRNAGRVTALLPLYSSAMEPELRKNGTVVYKYHEETGITEYAPEDILHLRLLGPGAIVGLSPLAHARMALGLSVSIEDHTGKFFQNGLRPGGVIQNKQGEFMKPEQRALFRESLKQQFGGTDNAFRTLVLEGGYEYSPVTLSPADAQMLEEASWGVEQLCRFFGVPPQLIGHTDKASSWASSLENTNLHFKQYGLEPYTEKWQQGIMRKLMTPQERQEYSVEFTFDKFLRADFKSRSEGYAKALGGPGAQGYMTVNEVRRLENLPDDPRGNEIIRATGPTGDEGGTQAPANRGG